MTAQVLTKTYSDFPYNDREILRYAGCKTPEKETLDLLAKAKEIAQNSFLFKVCYARVSVGFDGGRVALNGVCLPSKDLCKALKGCDEAVVFAATVGVEIDRLILKNERLSPSKAVFLQAIGAERIEALCNAFCKDFAKEEGVSLRPRFSPGYGDLPLETQNFVFRLLSPERKIGLTLGDSLLMSPTKSVTAFVGISGAGTR